MQFEQFDKKVREAAENHHPPYDEKAWNVMEKLLDKHLPREDDRRRRFIFFLLLFLLLGGGGVWLWSTRPWISVKSSSVKNITVINSAGEKDKTVSEIENKNKVEEISENKNNQAINIQDNKTVSAVSLPVLNKTAFVTENKQKPAIFETKKNRADQKETIRQLKPDNNTLLQPGPDKKDNDIVNAIPSDGINSLGQKKEMELKNDQIIKTDLSEKREGGNSPDQKVGDPDIKTTALNNPEKKTETKSKKRNTFSFTVSTGPDFSFAQNDKPGKTKLLAGGGLGYTVKDRFTIRTGFYSGRKIYTASPGAYHPPDAFWTYYPNLEKVEADCKVYEIPVMLSYQIGKSSRQNWLASAGLSSYLMKSELYNYYYKYTAGGPTVQRKWTIRDENKHYFSVLTLSGGYQKNIGKSFTFMAEPYMKIPLSGVGFGKVKLNSGGVLFTLGYKPFKREIKNQKISNTPEKKH